MQRPKLRALLPWPLALVALGCLSFPFVSARYFEWRRLSEKPAKSPFSDPAIAELDKAFQLRFAVNPTNNFGIGRIGERHDYFIPENGNEGRIIQKLRGGSQEVVFYVASRNLLNGWSTAGAWSNYLQGPIHITGRTPLRIKAKQWVGVSKYSGKYPEQPVFSSTEQPRDLPSEAALLKPLKPLLVSQSRFDHTATPESHQYRVGDWKVIAVPVRATDKSCISCHRHNSRRNPPRVGDPLGIALYATRPMASQSAQKSQIVNRPAPTPRSNYDSRFERIWTPTTASAP